ncbi:MAG: hypothetical protein LBQ16_01110, partial [Gracilibacteraceae bacterium]|nr:hypothetical protein [Gracilibacteraceae bacterium]
MFFVLFAAAAFFLAALIFSGAFWLPAMFGPVRADQILFQARVPAKGADHALVRSFVVRCLL